MNEETRVYINNVVEQIKSILEPKEEKPIRYCCRCGEDLCEVFGPYGCYHYFECFRCHHLERDT